MAIPSTDAAYTGQLVLLPLSTPSGGPTAAAGAGGTGLQPMIQCNGQFLSTSLYPALYSLINGSFGIGPGTFAVPKMTSPSPNLAWFICANGYYPSTEQY